MSVAPVGRLIKLSHDHRDMGFLSARLVDEYGCPDSWCLRVESPADVDEFSEHLHLGTSMALRMVTRDGRVFRGEACVSSVSMSADVATLVVLSGVGPLLND
jgi:hypothetical protein